MKLSTRGKYGLYAMYYLALNQDEGPQTLQSIATMGVPSQYLERLLGNLRRAGLVTTVRGVRGGYRLGKPPEQVTLLDIVDAVEGPIEISECTTAEPHCAKAHNCPVRWVWQRVNDSINAELKSIKLSDMLDDTRKSEAINHG